MTQPQAKIASRVTTETPLADTRRLAPRNQPMNNADLVALVDRLRNEPTETEWLEFKESKYDPQLIGEYFSALANAALSGEHLAEKSRLLYNKQYVSDSIRGPKMDALTYSQARSNLAKMMDKVCDDHSPLIITRKNRRSVVMISLDDYQAIEETAYLLRSPANARRLIESIAELESGGGFERKLDE
jgi:antitoxin YefM